MRDFEVIGYTYQEVSQMIILRERLRKIIYEEIDRMLFEETYGYKEFLADDQAIFKPGVSYEKYVSSLGNKVPKDQGSVWLYNHHAAEIAWEEKLVDKAKKHIALAAKINPFGNSITGLLDFIMNKRGSFVDLEEYINQNIEDDEKETAVYLLNHEDYGQTLKNK
jgi:hypothetical protein